MLRQNLSTTIDDARNQYVSPYEEWTSDELRELLVQYKIPIRDSANATHETLVRICDNVFGAEIAESEKDSRRQYSIDELVRMETAVRKIQRAFFRRQSLKRRQQSRRRRRYQNEEEYDCEDGCTPDHCDEDYSREVGGGEGEYAMRRQSMLRRINEQGDDYDEEIEVEWRKPSWKFAKRYEVANRPHRSGKRMPPYDWTSVTLGRHCYSGGCGEQLDLWNEGRTSEFSQFGSGITNYFKFLKWCAWVMLILSVIHLPILFINALGTNDKMGMSLSAAMTTFGNLGSAIDVGSVVVPGCDETEFQFEHCEIGTFQ